MIRHTSDMQFTEVQMRGGNGLCKRLELLPQSEMKHCRFMGCVTIDKGNSIGTHDHVNETEYYWIVSGEGVVTEADGEKPVGPGDLVITGGGASHAIRNEKDKPLVFMALIILD